jgi:hypothetical protein
MDNKSYKIKISKIDIIDNNFIIESDNGKVFMAPIKKGSIQCKIFNESNQEVNLSNIEKNNLVTIIGSNQETISDNRKIYNCLTNNLPNELETNNIIMKKIIVKNNYVFNSDSSDEYNNYS